MDNFRGTNMSIGCMEIVVGGCDGRYGVISVKRSGF